MKNFSIKKFTIYVCLAGAVFIVIATLWGMHVNNFIKQSISVQGTVMSLVSSRSTSRTSPGKPTRPNTYTYKPVVRFITQNGKTIVFTSKTGSNPAAYAEGETVEVLYPPSSPEKAQLSDFLSLWMIPMIFGGIGLVFIILGGGLIIIPRLKGRQNEHLKRNGTPLETDYQRVEKNKDINLGGKNPYRVITQWTDPSTSETHIFKSDNLWHDPTDQITMEKITVYIESNNPDKYYIDLTFLSKK